MRFVKMHGTGNDHVLVDAKEFDRAVAEAEGAGVPLMGLVRRVCDRRRGIGADGLLVVGGSRVADFSMRVFNEDGSEAEMCGNGIRCAGRYAYERGFVDSPDMAVETAAGVRRLFLVFKESGVASVRVDMGAPRLPGRGIEESIQCESEAVPLIRVSMGNPHAVLFFDTPVEDVSLENLAVSVASRQDLFPEGVNVEIVNVTDGGSALRLRVFERGCGETEACGTGACAAAVAYRVRCGSGIPDGSLEVRMTGGALHIEWDGNGSPVYMSGPAERVFKGEPDVFELFDLVCPD